MFSKMPRFMKLVKLGALGGLVFGVVQAVKRRRQGSAGETTWPTLAETAARGGKSLDADGTADAPPESVHEAADTAESQAGTADEAEAESSQNGARSRGAGEAGDVDDDSADGDGAGDGDEEGTED